MEDKQIYAMITIAILFLAAGILIGKSETTAPTLVTTTIEKTVTPMPSIVTVCVTSTSTVYSGSVTVTKYMSTTTIYVLDTNFTVEPVPKVSTTITTPVVFTIKSTGTTEVETTLEVETTITNYETSTSIVSAQKVTGIADITLTGSGISVTPTTTSYIVSFTWVPGTIIFGSPKNITFYTDSLVYSNKTYTGDFDWVNTMANSPLQEATFTIVNTITYSLDGVIFTETHTYYATAVNVEYTTIILTNYTTTKITTTTTITTTYVSSTIITTTETIPTYVYSP